MRISDWSADLCSSDLFGDREKLWNAVEAAENLKDTQLSREVEFAIPRELTREQGIELAREFAEAEFVEKGMIADLIVHWDRSDERSAGTECVRTCRSRWTTYH